MKFSAKDFFFFSVRDADDIERVFRGKNLLVLFFCFLFFPYDGPFSLFQEEGEPFFPHRGEEEEEEEEEAKYL